METIYQSFLVIASLMIFGSLMISGDKRKVLVPIPVPHQKKGNN
jgi:hypothetical protein